MTDTESKAAFDDRCREHFAATALSSTRPNTQAAELRCARLAREAELLMIKELENER